MSIKVSISVFLSSTPPPSYNLQPPPVRRNYVVMQADSRPDAPLHANFPDWPHPASPLWPGPIAPQTLAGMASRNTRLNDGQGAAPQWPLGCSFSAQGATRRWLFTGPLAFLAGLSSVDSHGSWGSGQLPITLFGSSASL